ncbi:MAG: hydrogenase expression/formation protein HypE [Desulfobacterales bacterium]|nr:hydrogenase expression/formation protein HypE [Desulfobacterales bacterium]
MNDVVKLAHGFGGRLSYQLIEELIKPSLGEPFGPTLDAVNLGELKGNIVFSTDSFTVSPQFFPGGDIGKLAACGTLNDLAMHGAKPMFLSLALIIEEGFPLSSLKKILTSIGQSSTSIGVKIVTGDTKVVEKNKLDGIIINTTGIGIEQSILPIHPFQIMEEDVILINGYIGDHGLAILNARHQIDPNLNIQSDCAVLWPMVQDIINGIGSDLHALRDPTRGGLAAALNEFAIDTGFEMSLDEWLIPIRPETGTILDVFGLDALSLANEGKCIIVVSHRSAGRALDIMRHHPLGKDSTIIGKINKKLPKGRVIIKTQYGTKRILEMPIEEGLPRIC